MDYITRFRQSEKRIKDQGIMLPEKAFGWLLLRRAALSSDQRSLVLSQVGEDIAFDKVQAQLKLVFGLDSIPDGNTRGKAAALMAEEHSLDDENFYSEEFDYH